MKAWNPRSINRSLGHGAIKEIVRALFGFVLQTLSVLHSGTVITQPCAGLMMRGVRLMETNDA